jgi:hypothetical protein
MAIEVNRLYLATSIYPPWRKSPNFPGGFFKRRFPPRRTGCSRAPSQDRALRRRNTDMPALASLSRLRHGELLNGGLQFLPVDRLRDVSGKTGRDTIMDILFHSVATKGDPRNPMAAD